MNGDDAKLCLPNLRFRKHRNTLVPKIDDVNDGYRCEDCGYEEVIGAPAAEAPPVETPP